MGERQFFTIPLGVEGVNVSRQLIRRVVRAPCAHFARPCAAGVWEVVYHQRARVFVRAIGVAFFADREGRVQEMGAVVLIVRVRLVGPTLVDVYNGAVVQCASYCPCDAFRAKALASRLRGPSFVKVDSAR